MSQYNINYYLKKINIKLIIKYLHLAINTSYPEQYTFFSKELGIVTKNEKSLNSAI